MDSSRDLSKIGKEEYHELQSDYYKVYTIANELTERLERTIKGEKTSPTTLSELRHRMVSTNEEAERRMRKRGMIPRRNRSLTERSRYHSIRKSDSLTMVPADPKSSSPPIQDTVASSSPCTSCLVRELNLPKISHILVTNPSTRLCALLLQALRQQVTVCSSKSYSQLTIELLAEKDFLLLKNRKNSVISSVYLSTENGFESKEQLSRLLNAIASFKDGRDYLLSVGQGKELLTQLLTLLRTRRLHSHTLDHLLATLQKLSIRSQVQRDLLQLGLLDWFLPLLEGRLSMYGMEFGVALLMNLCMNQNSQPTILRYLDQLLNCLAALLRVQNPAICSYVNGSFYGIFALGRVRSRARELNFEHLLQSKLERSDCTLDEFQLPYLMKQMKGEVEMVRIPLPPTDEEDTVGDNVESDLDVSDQLRAIGSELSGARLLISRGMMDKEKEREREKEREDVNVPGTVPQRHPQRRNTKKDSMKRNRGRGIGVDASKSEPRLSTSSQMTFIIEQDRRKPFVVTVGLTEAALQYRNSCREKERLEKERQKEEEEKRKKEEKEKEEEERQKAEEKRKSDEIEKKKEEEKKKKEREKERKKKREESGMRECKRSTGNKTNRSENIHEKEKKKKEEIEDARSNESTTRENSQISPKMKRESVEEVENAEKEKKEGKKNKPPPICLTSPIDEVSQCSVPVSSNVPQRIPDDANAYEYISVFGSRPKLPRTPEKDKKTPTTVLLY